MRRDNCLLVRNVVTTCLERILINKDVGGAQDYVRSAIADLLMNRMDLSLLVITKVCPRRPSAGPVQPVHACLASGAADDRQCHLIQPSWQALLFHLLSVVLHEDLH